MTFKIHRDSFFLGLIGILLFAFYPDLFLAKTGSLIGDHLEQHYPWAYLLSTSLKKFQLPFWTPLIQCGFPIAAESQIGVFYLPNLFLFFLLPFHWAYSYINIFHFFLAGYGTYFYAKQMKLTSFASFITAVVFLFGTSYGGAYYNITSLKTISWFPIALFLFEKFYQHGKKTYLLWLAFVLSQAVVAGYMQVAVFMLLIFLTYAVLRIFVFKDGVSQMTARLQISKAFWILCAMLLMVILAWPQISLTFELAIRSNRINLSEDYAYVGSMSPLALLTLFIPYSQGYFSGNSLYVGVFSVLLILCAFFSKSAIANHVFRLWLCLAAISFLLALGQWSPLYVALIKLTHFYSFRTPMKFIVFVCFGLAMFSGIGFDEAWKDATSSVKRIRLKPVAVTYFGLIGFVAALAGITYYFLTAGRPLLFAFGKWYINQFIYGKAGHPQFLETYYERLGSKIDNIWILFSVKEFWSLWTYLLMVGALFAFWLLRRKKMSKKWFLLGVIFLLADLYGFTWCDIRKDFDHYQNIVSPSPIVEELKRAKRDGSLGRIYGFRSPDEQLPLAPSTNILHEIEDIGVYSPFVLRRYFEVFGRFGNVNDSNFAVSPEKEFVLARRYLLNLVDVSHIVSTQRLDHPQFKLIAEEHQNGGIFLYENLDQHQRAFFISQFEVVENWDLLKTKLLTPGFKPHELLLLEREEGGKLGLQNLQNSRKAHSHLSCEKHGSDFEVWNVDVNQPGFFVISNVMYPGWKAEVNGTSVPILSAYGIFQAIWLDEAGRYQIHFSYRPFQRNG